ncbi:MAG: glycosyltransferase family 2 protein [Planctomycetota bacterium]|nr:glycosyltransferase family 2 protein [Planctomycetota bacterium]
MDWSSFFHVMFMSLYTFAMAMVSLYGLHRYIIVYLYYRHRKNVPLAPGQFEELPLVTIQLPMFNEQYVAKRIIEKACLIDYPREKLQIQVLDDSTDDTVQIAAAACEEARDKGFDVEHIHRTDRSGYKAGAMENGLKTAKGEFVMIFDADFVPAPDILMRSIHHFTNPKVCVVQTRWEHINRYDSLLTQSQAIYLDGHFAIEHVARNRSQRFMSFNGTAGTWRKVAIADAGGWHHDTLTEDLDLSYRAQMKGWKFVFLPEVTAPAELPPEMNAFKAQQFRWTKGGAQTALKMLPKVMLAKLPLKVKIEAFFHLTGFTVHIYVLLLMAMILPAMHTRLLPFDSGIGQSIVDVAVFALATMSAVLFYAASQIELFGDWRTILKFMPMLMALGVGLCVSNTKAILEALFGHKTEFVRTPKYGDARTVPSPDVNLPRKKKRRFDVVPVVEILFAIYMLTSLVISLAGGSRTVLWAPFLAMFAFGFLYVSLLSLQTRYAVRKDRQALQQKAQS